MIKFEKFKNYTILDYTIKNKNFLLKVEFEIWNSCYITDYKIFKIFPLIYFVKSGSWYQNYGRWRNLQKLKKEIIFEDFYKFKKSDAYFSKDKFSVLKFFSKKKIIIKSRKFGLIKFYYKNTFHSNYLEICFFNNLKNSFENVMNKIEIKNKNFIIFKKNIDFHNN